MPSAPGLGRSSPAASQRIQLPIHPIGAKVTGEPVTGEPALSRMCSEQTGLKKSSPPVKNSAERSMPMAPERKNGLPGSVTTSGTEGVGMAATRGVVLSIFAVMISNVFLVKIIQVLQA